MSGTLAQSAAVALATAGSRALKRDDEAIEHWVKRRWPHVKKAPGASTR
jgi:hypothetical protein